MSYSERRICEPSQWHLWLHLCYIDSSHDRLSSGIDANPYGRPISIAVFHLPTQTWRSSRRDYNMAEWRTRLTPPPKCSHLADDRQVAAPLKAFSRRTVDLFGAGDSTHQQSIPTLGLTLRICFGSSSLLAPGSLKGKSMPPVSMILHTTCKFPGYPPSILTNGIPASTF